MRGEDLMRQNFGAGVGKLAAFVAGEKARRRHLQLKPPRLVPFTLCRTIKRRINALKLLQMENLILGAIRRLHEDRRIKLNLRLLAANLLDVADTVGLVEIVRAANESTFSHHSSR